MRLVGLTGGIGAGKSTVSSGLARRGAVIVDADRIAREVVAPGGPAYQGVVDRFGSEILLPDGTIDRPALAALVFADDQARADLNGITHPAVGQVMVAEVAEHAGTDHVVVLDIPLLAEGGGRTRWPVAGVIVVDLDPDTALQRLVDQRGMDPADARARIAAQASREDRLALADFVVDNSGTPADLERELDRAWDWIASLPSS